VRSIQPDAMEFNPGSTQQMAQLLFAPCKRKLSKEKADKIKNRRIKIDSENIENESKYYEDSDESPIEVDDEKNSKKEVELLPRERTFRVENIFVNIH
jgi:hypothetical protein